MVQLALGVARRNLGQKVTLATDLVTGLTTNEHFTTPDPPLSALTGKMSAIDAKQKEIAKKQAEMEALELQLDGLEQDLGTLITQTGNYILATSKGDPVLIASTNAPMKGDKAPVG